MFLFLFFQLRNTASKRKLLAVPMCTSSFCKFTNGDECSLCHVASIALSLKILLEKRVSILTLANPVDLFQVIWKLC